MASPAEPEISCNNSVYTYLIAPKDLAAAKRQILRVAGDHPVIFMESSVEGEQVELMVIAASLTPSKRQELQALQQDGNLTRRLAAADFEGTQIRFGD